MKQPSIKLTFHSDGNIHVETTLSDTDLGVSCMASGLHVLGEGKLTEFLARKLQENAQKAGDGATARRVLIALAEHQEKEAAGRPLIHPLAVLAVKE